MKVISRPIQSDQPFSNSTHLSSPSAIIKKTLSVALPVIAMAMASSLPTVYAGDKEFIECVDACKDAGGGSIKCGLMCLVFLFLGN